MDNPTVTKPALGSCQGPQAQWIHDEYGQEELRHLLTGRCLTRAARLDDCAKAQSDPSRFTAVGKRVGEDSYEIAFPYSGDTWYYLQVKPQDPTVTTSTQRPAPPVLGFWRFV